MKRNFEMKRIIALLLTVALFAGFAACTKDGKKTDSALPTDASASAPATETAPTAAATEPAQTNEPTQTTAPDPDFPTDEWFIDEAWKFAQVVAELHDQHYSREDAYFWDKHLSPEPSATGNYCWIVFPSIDGPQDLMVEINRGSDGNFRVDADFASLQMSDDTYQQLLREKNIYEWSRRLQETQIVVTAEDIAAAGCTASEGREYMDTVYNCYCEKLMEFYRGLPADCPAYSYEAKLVSCVYDESADQYYMDFAFKAPDIFGLWMTFEDSVRFADENCDPEYYGWLILSGSPVSGLTQLVDGSWIGCALIIISG